jgi:energy-coupling factor transport system ATP-binding protein
MTGDSGVRFDRVGFAYPDAAAPVLHDITITIPEGELCLVMGPTGSGKSTLLQLANGLAPHFTGGTLTGSVTVDGRDTRTHPPRDLADVVGAVSQHPASGFVTGRVDDELAYGLEQLGAPDPVMRTRVEEIIDLLGLEPLRHRSLANLSAGQQQRVAIASVLTTHPRVLVLDEPTSALDPTAAEEVLAVILRLVHDLGMTVLLAEHRLERVVQYADSIVMLNADGTARMGAPTEILADSPLVPPVIELGRLAGWEPLPRSIRDARRRGEGLRERLEALVQEPRAGSERPRRDHSSAALQAKDLSVTYGTVTALAGVDLALDTGEVTAVMGRNGSGKTSLLWALQGSGVRSGGTVLLEGVPAGTAIGDRRRGRAGIRNTGVDPMDLSPDEAIRHIALVPQNPSDLLYLDSVVEECRAADRGIGAAPGTAAELLDRLAPEIQQHRHPRDLSEGERLAVVLAVQLVGRPRVLLLDEPTRGLDYAAKRRLSEILRELAASGVAILLSSHDVEFVAGAADRVLVLAGGELIVDGRTLDVLTASPSLAPQVARILRPLPLLTVEAVRSALGGDS